MTYSLAFMSLLFVTMSLIALLPAGGGWAFLLFAVVAPLHLYKQRRHAFGLTRFSALWRFVMLLCFNLVVQVPFIQTLLGWARSEAATMTEGARIAPGAFPW